MNLLKSSIVFCALVLITSCNSSTSNSSLPSNITVLDFVSASGFVASGSNFSGELVLNKNTNIYDGTFTFSYGTPASSCSLVITLTLAQSQQLDTYLNNASYCSKTNSSQATDCGTDSVLVNGSLKIWKSEAAGICQTAAYNYFCAGSSDVYSYLNGIIAANSDISTCSTHWSSMFL